MGPSLCGSHWKLRLLPRRTKKGGQQASTPQSHPPKKEGSILRPWPHYYYPLQLCSPPPFHVHLLGPARLCSFVGVFGRLSARQRSGVVWGCGRRCLPGRLWAVDGGGFWCSWGLRFSFFFFFWYLFFVVGCGLLLFELLFNFVFLYDLLFLFLCSMLFFDAWMVEVILKVCLLVVLWIAQLLERSNGGANLVSSKMMKKC